MAVALCPPGSPFARRVPSEHPASGHDAAGDTPAAATKRLRLVAIIVAPLMDHQSASLDIGDAQPGCHPDEGYRPISRGATLLDEDHRQIAGMPTDGRNALATATAGRTVTVPVYVLRNSGAARTTTVTLTAKSESDPTVSRSLTCTVGVGDTVPKPAPVG